MGCSLIKKVLQLLMLFKTFDDIINEYYKPYQRTIKVKPLDVESSSYIEFNVANNY